MKAFFKRLRELCEGYPVKLDNFHTIQHPLLNAPVTMVDGQMVLLNTAEKCFAEVQHRLDVIEKTCKTISEVFLVFINKPFYMMMLEETADLIDKEEYALLLADCWMHAEFPHEHGVKKIVKLFERADRELLWPVTDRLEFIKRHGSHITVYRGLQSSKSPVRGISWSVDKKVANWFATRWNNTGMLYQAVIHLDHIFYYTNERNEQEVIVHPRYLRSIEQIPLTPRDSSEELDKAREIFYREHTKVRNNGY